MNQMFFGGKPLSHNTKKDFPHALYFGATLDILKQLPPAGLGRQPFSRTNQLYTSFCTACATSTASAFIEGVEMSFEFQAAKISELVGSLILNGADPQKAMQAMVLYGSLPKALAPMSLDSTPAATLADWKKWPAPLDEAAAKYEKQSYFRADTGPFDRYDNIRVAMYQADLAAQEEATRTGQPKKEYVVMAFSQWQPQWSGARQQPDGSYTSGPSPVIVDYVPPIPKLTGLRAFLANIFPSIFGAEDWHAYLFIDWALPNNTEALTSQNSYPWLGNNGIQYFTRPVINAAFADPRAGCYIFRDLDPNIVKAWQAQQTTLASIFAYLKQRL